MIKSITLCRQATYGDEPVEIDGLSQFNYFYGANGSGKTTISRVIADEDSYDSCQVNWTSNSPLEAIIYNRDFVEANFREADDLPGIFTLGEHNADTITKIEVAKRDRDSLADEIRRLKSSLQGEDGQGGKLGEIAVAQDAFRDKCWKQQVAYKGDFKKAFEGFRNTKANFCAKVLSEQIANKATSHNLEHLKEKAKTIFAGQLEKVDRIPTIQTDALEIFEKDRILFKTVVGRSDVDIAELINRLGNSDWVRSGREYFNDDDKICPFCQQEVSGNLTRQLEEYFDETFEADTKVISDLVVNYQAKTEGINNELSLIENNSPVQLDLESFSPKIRLLESQFEFNAQKLDEKEKEPSRSITLKNSSELLETINALIESANGKIAEHNRTVDNASTEAATLTAEVWRYLLDEPLKDDLADYLAKKQGLDVAVESIRCKIREKESAYRDKAHEISELEKAITSIQPTIDEINALLRSFGFDGFVLAQVEDRPCYKLIRSDGCDAKETLSEGEKTFVTFLYFYHLLKGSPDESGTTNDRIVVIDDPVSSLDSDILFIVSTLIRKVCDEVRNSTGSLKQLLLLTHNVYFHKEVTYNNKRGKDSLREETFWTVRKANGLSEVSLHNGNPIKSSYELLWGEIREGRTDNLSLQNSLRRILESYFKMLGGIDLNSMHERFEGKEKLACKSLLSWVNDGSHSAHDDLYVSVDDSTAELYLKVFQDIFEQEGHVAHYTMMMAGADGATA